MSAPFHAPHLDGIDIEIWPPVVDLSPELIAYHVEEAKRLRLQAIHGALSRLARAIMRRVR